MNTLQDTKKRVDNIDLEPIIFSLVQREDGPKWNISKAREIETWYRRYLFLCSVHSGSDIIPTHNIDIFWHTHILDTSKYMKDCDYIFGHYLHHFPYIGLRGEKDKKSSKKAFDNTLKLFELHYQDTPVNTISKCGSNCGGGDDVSNCGGEDNDDNISLHICDYESRPVLTEYKN